MDSWVLLSILAAFFFAFSAVAVKMLVSPGHENAGIGSSALLFLLGAGIVLVGFAAWQGLSNFPTGNSLVYALASGILWGFGMVVSLMAYKGGAAIARVAPIVNSNTLIIVIIGIFLLNETPSLDQMARVAFGALLILVGGALLII